MTSRQRHPNRAGLRAIPSTTASGPVFACRCPVKIVTGTAWAYDRRLDWHDPAEHGTWTPPRQPARAPLPPALLQWSDPRGRPASAGPAKSRGSGAAACACTSRTRRAGRLPAVRPGVRRHGVHPHPGAAAALPAASRPGAGIAHPYRAQRHRPGGHVTADEPAGNQLREALTRTADGLPTAQAAVRLVLEHGDWPERLAAADLVEFDDAPDSDPAHLADPRYAWVAWRSAIASLDAGDLYGSSSDAQVLRIAASLGGAVPVDLSDVLPGLDRTTLGRVLAALSHASSSQQHPDNSVEWPANGGPATLTRPRATVGPLGASRR